MRTSRLLTGIGVSVLLQGCLGDQIVGPASQPGPGVTIRLNCARPLHPSGPPPLIIVDGERLSDEQFRARGIRPADVEHLEVVKPGLAIADYGRAGEHGVILIRTKGGSDSTRRA